MSDRALVSRHDLVRPGTRIGVRVVHALVFAGLVIAGLGPLVWLAFASLNTTQEVLRDPFAVWFHADEWGNYASAFGAVNIGRYLLNTVIVAVGSCIANLVVASSAAYVIAILKPRWAGILSGAILATLFLPGVVSLVPLYLTVLDVPPFGISLQNTYWAVWLPAAANAFSILIMVGFFRSMPRELIEAARIDGVGNLRMLWYIVLPLSRPILGVVALLAIIAAWKDYLWPSLVLADSAVQPISVALPLVGKITDLSVFLAALFLATIIPVLLFLVFSKQILSGVGATSGLKD
ncbi:MAG: ABC transporter permease [Micrococcales bacterium 70-64]|mgnify:CR=1 FL=1|nr:carbohydrate ABC transporter permease [Leifsonia sp.]ODU64653.1 MAG: ABC transporter permease [Leifsonia sp. SCN 70-46]OJX86344.1 MAG: ABC transporter permease [Micrococcales bacterium 70-64]